MTDLRTTSDSVKEGRKITRGLALTPEGLKRQFFIYHFLDDDAEIEAEWRRQLAEAGGKPAK